MSPPAPNVLSVTLPVPSATTAASTVNAPAVRSTSMSPSPAAEMPTPAILTVKPSVSVMSTLPLRPFTALTLSMLVRTVIPLTLLSTAFAAVIVPPA